MAESRLESCCGGNAARNLGGPWRWLYTNNPFYLISAWLVFYGLRTSFGSGAANHAQALMIGLVAYTLLLAISAIVLIRWWKVWDDARGILLLVVLMLLAISVCFDDALAQSDQGGWYFLGGLLFSVFISEAILLGARIKLPLRYRGPYYLLLGLFFLYPVGLAPLLGQADTRMLHFALLGFPLAFAAALLTLLPAVWRGAKLVETNGTPWRWPLYPWTLFGLVICCGCFRTYYLCASFSMFDIFGFYFLAPILFAVAILQHEAAVCGGFSLLQRTATLLPLVVFSLTLTASNKFGATSTDFLQSITVALGATPQFATLVAATGFYSLCALRRLPLSTTAFGFAVALLSIIGPTTANIYNLQEPWGAPLMLVSLLVMAIAGKRRDLKLAILASICGLLGLTLDVRMASWRSYLYLRQFVSGLEYIAVGAISFLIAMLISLSKTGLFQRLAARWRNVFS